MKPPVVLGLAALLACVAGGAVRAEIVEEVVAFVNGDIITRSELESEEQLVIAEAYRRLTGEELDQQVAQVREGLLIQMIDARILLDRAKRLYDVDKMAEVFYEGFREQQGIESDEEFERLLEKDGMTLEDVKERLVALYAPEEVKRFEVGSRVAISDAKVQEYYDANPELFLVPGEVTVREIVLLAESAADKDRRRAEALDIRDRAVTGDFAAIAVELSEAGTKDNGGLLGPLKQGELSEQLDEQAFGLPVGEVSELLETPYGFHILKVETRMEQSTRPLEEVLEPLRRSMEDNQYQKDLNDFLMRARDEAEWCVKKKFRDRLPEPLLDNICTGV